MVKLLERSYKKQKKGIFKQDIKKNEAKIQTKQGKISQKMTNLQAKISEEACLKRMKEK